MDLLSPPILLSLTLGTAGLLIYFLLQSEVSPPSEPDHRITGERYFQDVLGEMDSAASGTEQGCAWSQDDDEVHITVPLPSDARSKDCQCKILDSSLNLSIKGSTVLQGKLFRRVKPDDCDWTIEDEKQGRTLRLTLVKSQPTKGTQHWTSLLLPKEC
uniref:CS domain-containing protein n=1 Tax=Haptolina brevifila TaxID=156173 RepID=A0A7S2GCQ0_9EUKA|mmetsp:Transcript_33932/g.67554  ORF Transcript_33932/g.67554 Transcript_33932/m.67554 type:complete len:158 (+) Transcript_33932:172-645(+)